MQSCLEMLILGSIMQVVLGFMLKVSGRGDILVSGNYREIRIRKYTIEFSSEANKNAVLKKFA